MDKNKSDFSCGHKIGRHLKLKKGSQDRQNVAKGSRIKEYVCAFVNRNQSKWYFIIKIVLTYCEKKTSNDQKKLLKFEAEGREFAKFLRSLEQFIHTVKGQNNFW